MVLIGRIFAGLLAIPLLLVGALALTLAHMQGTELVQSLYTAMQSGNAWLIDQGADIPLDASVRFEEWLVHPLLRFTMLPLGLVFVFLASGIGMAGKTTKAKASKKTKGADADEEQAEEQNDKKTSKKLRKTAAAMAKKGEAEEAAQMLWSAGELDAAAELFIEQEKFEEAAAIRHDQNRFHESAELHLQAGNHENAGAIYAQVEAWKEAGDCYHKADSLSVAAEMYEKGGQHGRAAECYKAVEFHRHAASNYVKVQKWAEAAECLGEVLRDELNKSKGDPAKGAELKKLGRQVAKLHLRAEDKEQAQAVLKEAECFEDAAKVALSLEKFAEAAELFRDAQQPEAAADALRQLGEDEAAARLLGAMHRDRGELAEAAELMREAKDFLEAGDLFRQMEQYEQAGDCYEKQGDWGQAAEMFQIGGDRARAAADYEKAGKFPEAAECWALAGVPEKEAEALDHAGRFLKSGQVYHREGRDEEAITVLQKLQPDDDGFGKASALLGDIFRSRGQLSLAIKKLQQSLGGAVLDTANMPIYYTLASIHAEAGELPQAVEIFEKILALDYHFEDVEQRLVQLKERLGAAPPGAVGPAQTPVMGATDASAGQTPGVSAAQPGRYQILGELGRGGMGIVYKAKDTVLDRLVAYKVLPESLKENPQAVENFLREAKAAAKLNHPNIVTVYDCGEQDGRYYIAMEYVDGTTLKEILRRRGRISAAGILHVLVQMSEALAYAHEQKVVHRDIKPANAMWTRDKKAKLMDFGLAKVVEEVRNHTTAVAGTPYYMSPEQTLGKNIDHRTDIYSLGVALFEMSAGIVPFKEGNIPYHHVHTPPPNVLEASPDLPKTLAAIIHKCLEKDPAKRFQSAREILTAVRSHLGGPAGGSAAE